MLTHRRVSRSLIALLAATAVLTGCSGEPEQDDSPDALLAKAKTTMDAATSVHFQLTSSEVPPGPPRLVGGEGVAARPQAFKGTMSVLLNGSTVSLEIVSVDGKVYAKPPFSQKFGTADPEQFGLNDPALLIDPDSGLSRLVSEMTGATVEREARISGDVVTEIRGQVPGTVVKETLTSADPAQPVQVKAFIVKDTGELRRAELTGPFFEAGKNSTFALVLDQYGEQVSITAPPL